MKKITHKLNQTIGGQTSEGKGLTKTDGGRTERKKKKSENVK